MPQAKRPIDFIVQLNANATCIADLTAVLTPAQLETRPSGNEWSAVELLGHLRACSDVWGGCMRRLVAEKLTPSGSGGPRFAAVSPRTSIEKTDYLWLGLEAV